MKRCDSLKSILILCLGLACLGETRVYAGWQLTVGFTTTSPGGDLRFEPRNVHVVWVENATGGFVKTIGRWGVEEEQHLTQWKAADGTNIDGWTGATPQVYQRYTVTWNLTDRTGVQVPDGIYFIRFELTNNNATLNQYRRTTVAFLKDSVPKSQFYAAQDGYLNITLDYTFTPTAVPQVTNKPATYVTSGSARLGGQVVDAGGEDPNVSVYWGDSDGGTDAKRWAHVLDPGRRTVGPLRVDIADLDAATQYYYRFYARNSAGGRWADKTESFWTYGALGQYTGYRVQSSRMKVEGKQVDIPILPVHDTSRAFALISYGTGWQPDVENADAVMVRGRLLDKGTVRIERVTPTNFSWVSWQVIECLGQEFRVYRGTGSLATTEGSVDAPLNGGSPTTGRRSSGPVLPDVKVDPTRCLAFVTADTSSASRTYYSEALLTAYVNANTTVRIERAASGHAAANYNWVVVEFAPGAVASIQHGSLSFTSPTDTAPASRKIAPVNPGSSILIYQARTTANGLCNTAVAGRLPSASTVEFYGYTGTSGTRYVEYYVIDFGPSARAQRGKLDFSNDNSWYRADCHLTPAVDLSRALFFHGQTCNGTGDLYTRPFSTAELTGEDNLRIERQYPGQQSHIEWQVLELPPVTFVAQEPDIDVVPASLAFGATAVGTHADLTFTIRNVGSADLHVDSLEFTGLSKAAYSLVSPPAVPFTLAALTGSKTVTVRFTPTAAQNYDYAKLVIGSDDPDEPVVELALTGAGRSAQ